LRHASAWRNAAQRRAQAAGAPRKGPWRTRPDELEACVGAESREETDGEVAERPACPYLTPTTCTSVRHAIRCVNPECGFDKAETKCGGIPGASRRQHERAETELVGVRCVRSEEVLVDGNVVGEAKIAIPREVDAPTGSLPSGPVAAAGKTAVGARPPRARKKAYRDEAICDGAMYSAVAPRPLRAGTAVDLLGAHGYFLAGLFPRWFDHEALVLQKLTLEPGWGRMKVFADRTHRILELIRRDRERVRGLP